MDQFKDIKNLQHQTFQTNALDWIYGRTKRGEGKGLRGKKRRGEGAGNKRMRERGRGGGEGIEGERIYGEGHKGMDKWM